jgi:hypothetical protein
MLLPPASWYKLLPACWGVVHWQAGTGLHLLAKEERLVGLVQACTHLAKSYSLPSRLKPVPACWGIAPWQAGTSLYQLTNKLSLSKQVPAHTWSPTNSFLAGWYNLVPARQGVIPWWDGTSRSPGATTLPPGKTACRRGFAGFTFYQCPLFLLFVSFSIFFFRFNGKSVSIGYSFSSWCLYPTYPIR